MISRLRISRPSPAILVAVLALVAALAGTAIAQEATTSAKAVTKKKVKKIANKQIDKRLPWGSEDIADGAVTNAKIANDAVDGPKVANNSLGGEDVNESDLGPTLDLTYARRANQCTVAEGTQASCTATCPDGLNAVGGGVVAEGNHNEQVFVNGSRFNPNAAAATGWTGFVDNNADLGGADNNNNVTTYVICTNARNTAFTPVTG